MMDATMQRIAVIFLGLVVLACVVGGIILSSNDHTIPDAIIAIGAGAGGALAGLIQRNAPAE